MDLHRKSAGRLMSKALKERYTREDQFQLPINSYLMITISALLVILLMVPGISQQNAAQDRTQCIRECKQRFGSDFLWGGGGGSQQLYYLCLTDCDNKYWAELDKEMDKDEGD